MSDAAGLYISVPFCRAKCSFCNFASDAFAPALLPSYMASLEREVRAVRARAGGMGTAVPERADSVYFGGGTPSLLSAAEIERIFSVLRSEFVFAGDAEMTVECAPGQLSEGSLEAFVRAGVNRFSFGVQSFVDQEVRGVGRSHTAALCLADLERVRAAAVENVSVDLIAGLPGQTEGSWRRSVDAVLESRVPHASVYLLEVDEDSRLGREVLRGGLRYGAKGVPDDDACVDFYESACDRFASAGLAQYEISNFARAGRRSRHNVKYWTRMPYLGFGLDAHSMLRLDGAEALRFANTDDLTAYVAPGRGVPETGGGALALVDAREANRVERVSAGAALEEMVFLGLRMNDGIALRAVRAQMGDAADAFEAALAAAADEGLLECLPDDGVEGERLRLTRRGRALSNEVFARLLLADEIAA